MAALRETPFMTGPLPGAGKVRVSGFRPYPLLRNAHLQTVLPALFRPQPVVDWRIERRETPDGDFVDVASAGSQDPRAPCALLVHGLGGGFRSKYLCGLTQRLIARGWRVVALQLRGGGETPNRLACSYHHGDTRDLRWLWGELHQAAPLSPLAVVGWSLGGNVVLKALAEEGASAPVAQGVAVSVPFALEPCAERLQQGVSRVYQRELLRGLRPLVARKLGQGGLPEAVDGPRALAAANFFEFDDAFTAPLNGFVNARDYYARAACGQYLRQIGVPTLIMHAMDDPFMSPEIVPRASDLSPTVELELSRHGGHVGFVGRGRFGLPVPWMERRIARALRHLEPKREGRR